MKLVFWEGIGGDNMPIKLLGTPTVPANWCAIHWAPTEEDWSPRRRFLRRLGFGYFRGPKWIADLYADFATLCMPEGGVAYAVLSPVWGIGGFDALRKKLDTSGLQSYVLPRDSRGSRDTLIAELHKEHIGMVFEENSWQVGRHYLLVSRQSIADWRERLQKAHDQKGFDYDLLNRLEVFVSNYHEHGIEAISMTMTIDTLRSIARQVSDKLRVPMEIKETKGQKV